MLNVRFPLDEEICQEWIDALNQPGFVVKEKSMVCDRHFVDDDWSTTTTKKRRIKFGAKPTQHLAPPDCPERMQMEQKMDRER